MPDIETISFSRMNTFNTCRRKYRYVYVEKIKRPPNSALAFGSVNHKVQDYAYSEQIETGNRPKLEHQKEYYAESLDKTFDTEGVDLSEDDSRDKLQKHGLSAVEIYDREIAPTVTKPLHTEKPFEIGFANLPYKLVGWIDLVQEDEIVDHKFGKNHVNPLDPKVQLQAVIYQLSEFLDTGKNKKLAIHSNRRGGVRGEVSKNIKIEQWMEQATALEDVAESARAMNVTHNTGDYPKVNNIQICSWCQYKDLCGIPAKK